MVERETACLGEGARVGLDIGGTSVKAGRIRGDGTIEEERSADVPEGGDGEGFIRLLADLARGLGVRGPDEVVGVGIPGLIDRERGMVLQSPNLARVDELPVRDGLAAALGLGEGGVRLENDANVAILGEQWLGAAQGEPNAMIVTLGTGVGGGLLLGDELFLGEGMAGEIGHMTVEPGGPPCGCGSRGCVETLASATAARRRAIEAGLPVVDPGNLPLLNERAAAGEGPERELMLDIGKDLGLGLGAAVCLLDLRCYVFSGGFSAAFDVLEPGIRAGIRESAYGDRVEHVRLARARLGGSAGWIGAARLAFG